MLSLVRRRLASQSGLTLSELMVSMFVMGVVTLVFTSVLASVQRGVVIQDKLSRTLEEARLAVQQLDREMRSGNVLYDPTLENNGLTSCAGCLPNYTLRVYTQTNAPSRGSYTCTLWQIDGNQRLLTRSWPPNDPDAATDWRVVAEGIVSRELAEPAFALDPDPLKGNRTLNIALAVNSDLAGRPQQTVRIHAALTGRNTSYGFPGDVCESVPA